MNTYLVRLLKESLCGSCMEFFYCTAGSELEAMFKAFETYPGSRVLSVMRQD
jgi:hypothetical protein